MKIMGSCNREDSPEMIGYFDEMAGSVECANNGTLIYIALNGPSVYLSFTLRILGDVPTLGDRPSDI
jgi:hypothetical protein